MRRSESGRAPLIQYWHSKQIPEYLVELLASFAEHNPAMRRLVFDERTAAELIGERFGERHTKAFEACAVRAMQSDYFRYCALHTLGGVYADVDLRCVGGLDRLLEDPARATLFGRPQLPPYWRKREYEWAPRVGPFRVLMNSFLAFPAPGHPLLELAIEIATANIERRIGEDVALVTGPLVLTSLYLLRELGSFDAFRRYAEGGALEHASGSICETVGEYGRIEAAFEGVRLLPASATADFIQNPDEKLPYKGSEDHWINVKSSIYRRARA